MVLTGIGDMAQQLSFARNTTAIKTDLNRLTTELSTGKRADLANALSGDTSRFTSIRSNLTQVEAYLQTANETATRLEQVQNTLARFDKALGQTADQLLKVTDISNAQQVDRAVETSQSAFVELVQTLNIRIGDRSLFSGTAVDAPALQGGDAMLADIAAGIPPNASAADILQAVEDWFQSPAGGFNTTGYLGATGGDAQVRISDARNIEASPRADNAAIRDALQAVASSAVLGNLPTSNDATRLELVKHSGEAILGAAAGVVGIRASLGASQQILSEEVSQLRAEKVALSIQSNQLDAADPFETAVALQAVQVQLEAHFSAVARVSQLSLLRYL